MPRHNATLLWYEKLDFGAYTHPSFDNFGADTHPSFDNFGAYTDPSFDRRPYLIIDSLGTNNAIGKHKSGSSLPHVMVCDLFGAGVLPETMLTYGQCYPWEQF